MHALLQAALPPDYLARLLAIVGDAILESVVTVCATENDADSLTLDLVVSTDMSKNISAGVLEHKKISVAGAAIVWPGILGLRTANVSKLSWEIEAGGASIIRRFSVCRNCGMLTSLGQYNV